MDSCRNLFIFLDIILYNSAGNHFDTRVNDISVVVHHSGQVYYLPPLKFETFCPHRLNEENVIVCSFKFGRFELRKF